ncbi:MAG: transcriptional regulator NrdR [Bdellovibrionota bacterium]
MHCPKCSSDKLSVIDSRGDGNSIRRRRECQECAFRFTTFERVELSLPLVIKKDGRREIFNREKVRGGIMRACEKRPVSMEKIDRVVDSIERKINEMCVKEVSGEDIGRIVMEEIQSLDQIAYVRFASVYREFSDISQFVETLKNLVDTAQAPVAVKPVKKAVGD